MNKSNGLINDRQIDYRLYHAYRNSMMEQPLINDAMTSNYKKNFTTLLILTFVHVSSTRERSFIAEFYSSQLLGYSITQT